MTEGMQLSTVVSDGLLALVTTACAARLISRRDTNRTFAAACLFFIALAAAFGAARYGGADVVRYHEALSWTARVIAVPMLGAVFLVSTFGRRLPRYGWYGISALFGAAGYLLPRELGVVPGAVGMLLFLIGAARVWREDARSAQLVVVGVALTLLAGLVVGTNGAYGPVPRVDVFHALLMGANVAFTVAIAAISRR